MPRSYVQAGDCFGGWTAWNNTELFGGHMVAICRCSCGVFKRVRSALLLDGKRTHCHMCSISTHRMTKTSTWLSWSTMRNRCGNSNYPGFKDYGGRGIKVCDEWSSFERFLHDMGERPLGLTLDRIDLNLGYTKENCQWATKKEQAMNRRSTVWIEFEGRTYTAIDLARHLGMNYHTVLDRLKLGKKIDAPVKKYKSKADV